jgi:hypothetical protein
MLEMPQAAVGTGVWPHFSQRQCTSVFEFVVARQSPSFQVEHARRREAAAHGPPRVRVVHEHGDRREVCVEAPALAFILFLAGDGDASPEAGAGEHDGGDQGAGERGRAHTTSSAGEQDGGDQRS